MYKFLIAFMFVFSLYGFTQSTVSSEPRDLTSTQFLSMVNSFAVPVLVHLKADWCVVCQKESPLLLEFQTKHPTEVIVKEIDLDLNPLLGEYFEIDALPVHLLYFKGNLVWSKVGKLDFNQLEEVLFVLLKQTQKTKH